MSIFDQLVPFMNKHRDLLPRPMAPSQVVPSQARINPEQSGGLLNERLPTPDQFSAPSSDSAKLIRTNNEVIPSQVRINPEQSGGLLNEMLPTPNQSRAHSSNSAKLIRPNNGSVFLPTSNPQRSVFNQVINKKQRLNSDGMFDGLIPYIG